MNSVIECRCTECCVHLAWVQTCEMGWLTYTQPVSGFTLRYSGCSLDMEYVTAALVPKSSSWAATRKKLVPIIVSSRRKSMRKEFWGVQHKISKRWFYKCSMLTILFSYLIQTIEKHIAPMNDFSDFHASIQCQWVLNVFFRKKLSLMAS